MFKQLIVSITKPSFSSDNIYLSIIPDKNVIPLIKDKIECIIIPSAFSNYVNVYSDTGVQLCTVNRKKGIPQQFANELFLSRHLSKHKCKSSKSSSKTSKANAVELQIA